MLKYTYSPYSNFKVDAALYINPFNPKDIVDKIIALKTNKQLYDSLVQKGKCRIKDFPVASKRCEKIWKYVQRLC